MNTKIQFQTILNMATELNTYDYSNIFSVYTTEEGYEFFNLLNAINIDGEIDPSLYSYDVAYDFRSVYELSKKHYGTPRLWWIILIGNNIKNPFDLKEGTRVKILKTPVVTQIVSQINNS